MCVYYGCYTLPTEYFHHWPATSDKNDERFPLANNTCYSELRGYSC